MPDANAPIRIFEDEHVSLHYRKGSTPYALATFAPIGFAPVKTPYWGGTFCDKLDIECLGFVARRPNWFPARSMDAAIRAAAPYRLKPLVNYGHSQGGYAAIKYSRALNAVGSIAGAPQFSIDPQSVPFDTRFTEYFRHGLNAGMDIRRADQAGRILLLHDPLHDLDHESASRILDQGHPGTVAVPAFYIGHTVTDLLVDRQFILLLIESALGPLDMPSIMVRLRQLKHRSMGYSLKLAGQLVARQRPARAVAVLEAFMRNATVPLGRKDRAQHAMAGIRAYGGAGLMEKALEQAATARRLRRRNAQAQIKIGHSLLAIGAPGPAAAAFRAAMALEPDDGVLHATLQAALRRAVPVVV